MGILRSLGLRSSHSKAEKDSVLHDCITINLQVRSLCGSLRQVLVMAQRYECGLIKEALRDFDSKKETSVCDGLSLVGYQDIMLREGDQYMVRRSRITGHDIVHLIEKLEKLHNDTYSTLRRMRMRMISYSRSKSERKFLTDWLEPQIIMAVNKLEVISQLVNRLSQVKSSVPYRAIENSRSPSDVKKVVFLWSLCSILTAFGTFGVILNYS